jgi:deferrochelatase/peroxidase EfeB
MTAKSTVALEMDDIQAGALEPRPVPYAGVYQILRLDDRHAGRELLRRLIPYLNSVASFDPKTPVSLAVALSFQGLEALGVPEESLATFPPEFQQGMAVRAAELGDVGENAPEHWEKPLGPQDVHLVVVGLAPDTASLEAAVRYARDALRDLSGVVPIWRQDVHAAADLRNMFGFADGIAHPAVEGTGIPGTNPYEVPLKAGEFVLGYEDETLEPGAVGKAPDMRTSYASGNLNFRNVRNVGYSVALSHEQYSGKAPHKYKLYVHGLLLGSSGTIRKIPLFLYTFI